MNSTAALAIDLFHRVRSQPGNLLISPYSVWLAVAMLYPGARGKTRDALSAVLGIDDVAAVRRLADELAKRKAPTEWQRRLIEQGYQQAGSYGFHLDVANKLWVQSGYRIRPEYGQQLADSFGVDPAPVDFARAPDAACDAINRWVDDQTHGRIKDIVSAELLPANLRALLANAIYFKAGWASEFHERATQPRPFKLLDGTTISVATMWQTAGYRHAEDGGVTVVELPYIQPEVSMIVLAPHAGTFAEFERQLTLARLDALLAKLVGKQVDLKLPKFRFATSLTIARSLCEIGLAEVMSPAADLSGISDEPGFGVGEILHKTFIAIDEKGTEAAAVTAMMIAGAAPPPKSVTVEIDRPFYVLVRDNPTGTALFLGRVVDPR